MEFEICFFYASKGSIVRGPHYEHIVAESQVDAIGKFYQRHGGAAVHCQYISPTSEIHEEPAE